MNYHLKKYVFNQKKQSIRLGFNIKITDTPINTMTLLSNLDNERVVLATLQSDAFGTPRIFAYLVNNKKYDWARAEGFTFNEMIELEKENVFIKIDPSKVAEYLL